jgi:hypothetical protein
VGWFGYAGESEVRCSELRRCVEMNTRVVTALSALALGPSCVLPALLLAARGAHEALSGSFESLQNCEVTFYGVLLFSFYSAVYLHITRCTFQSDFWHALEQ